MDDVCRVMGVARKGEVWPWHQVVCRTKDWPRHLPREADHQGYISLLRPREHQTCKAFMDMFFYHGLYKCVAKQYTVLLIDLFT